MPETAKRVDPYITCRFHVEIDGIEEAAFGECSGLEAETEVLTYEQGGVNDHPDKLPGRTKFTNVSLKRGVTDSNALWEWYSKVIQGKVERKSFSIILYDPKGSEVKRWSFERAYPVKWSGPGLKSEENTVAIESLELTHEGMNLG
ncbi:MAG: phage tail protein [Dehalococcoidia bacterium]|nr:phage tail protein [Dehalococcoidia bacterium]